MERRLFAIMKDDIKPNQVGYSIEALQGNDILCIFETKNSPKYVGKISSIYNKLKSEISLEEYMIEPVDNEDLMESIADKIKEKLDTLDEPVVLYIIGPFLKKILKSKQSNLGKRVEGIAFNVSCKVGNTKIIRLKELSQEAIQLNVNDMFYAINEVTNNDYKRNNPAPKRKDPVHVTDQHNKVVGSFPKESNDVSEKPVPDGKKKEFLKESNVVSGKPVLDEKKMGFLKNNKVLRQEPYSAESVDIHKIEESIFSLELKEKEREEKFSPLRKAKAELAMQYRERLDSHIECIVKKHDASISLSKSQFFQFSILLMKTESADDFQKSWLTQEPNIEVILTATEYKDLSEESCYYNKICNTIYGEDSWNY